MNWMNILSIFLEGAVPIILSVIGALTVKWLKKKGIQDDELQYLQTAYSLLTKAVINTNQLWVDAIKKSEGSLTEAQKAEARVKTTEIFKEMITDNVKLALETAYGSVDKWLDLNLEAAVGEVKNSK